MPLHFAAARLPHRSPVARVLARQSLPQAANDLVPSEDDEVLHAALRHFASHGLGAARTAHLRAHDALLRGDDGEGARWTGICRLLDRRLAADLPGARGAGVRT